MQTFRVGIDLGTTNTLACYMKDGKPTMIKFPMTQKMLPSILYLDEDGSVIVGGKARNKGCVDPLNQIRSSKTEMGNFEKKWTLRGREFTPTDVATEILREVKKAVIRKVKPEDSLEVEAVITVPAYFTANQIDETKKAGEEAGLKVLGIITEPRAAAIANIKDSHIENQKILVADLGGGTFDVSVLEAGETSYHTLAIDGDRRLGGDDFDDRLADYIRSRIEDDLGLDLSSQESSGLAYNDYYKMMASIRDGACELKTELSDVPEYELIIPNLFPYKGDVYSLTLTVTREKFEALCEDLFEKIRSRILKVFADNPNLTPGEIENVILAGGSCYIPRIKSDVEQLMGRSADTPMDRSTMVVLGACFVADAWDKATGDVRDIISHSLGVEVLREDGVLTLTKLLRRGESYPCRAKRAFTTSRDNQESVEITIFEAGSDKEDVEELYSAGADGKQVPVHDLYGSFCLEGIQKAPKGVPNIEVTFEYDRSRLLTVTAEDVVTGAKKRIAVTKGLRAAASSGKAEPVDFELLIDISYSMEGTPLRQAKSAAVKLASEIIDLSVHRLGVISFGSRVKEVCPPTTSRTQLVDSIRTLATYGGTEMSGAIELGASTLAKSNRRKVLLLVTDGEPNSRPNTVRAADQAKARGIDIITIAAGDGADIGFLDQLASNPDYAFSIRSMDQLAGMFETAVEQYLANAK